MTRGIVPLEARALANLFGVGISAVVTLGAIPPLLKTLGADRFAVLMLVWAATAFFAHLDLGLGRALSHLLADERRGDERPEEAALFGTMLALAVAVTLALCALCAPFVPLVADSVVARSGAGAGEARAVVALTLGMLPFTSLGNALADTLQAWRRIDLLNLARIPIAILFVVAPLVVFPATLSLAWTVAAMLAVRAVGCAALYAACRVAGGASVRHPRLTREAAVRLVRFGSWAAISMLVRPLLLYLDRFLIAALLPLAAVAYYATPQEVLLRLLLVPATALGVVFPAVAAVRGDPEAVSALSRIWHRHVFTLVAPPSLVLLLLGPELLRLWLGPEAAAQGGLIVRLLALGALANALAQVTFTIMQAVGRPDLGARQHLWQLPIYALAAGGLIVWLGPVGAAIAWAARSFVELGALLLLCRLATPGAHHAAAWRLAAASALIGGASLAIEPLAWRLALLVVLLALVGWFAWGWWRDPARVAR